MRYLKNERVLDWHQANSLKSNFVSDLWLTLIMKLKYADKTITNIDRENKYHMSLHAVYEIFKLIRKMIFLWFQGILSTSYA